MGFSYEPKFFDILEIGQKYFSFYPLLFYNIHS